METNVNMTVVTANRKPISMIGANLGTQYFQAEQRSCWPKFEEDQHAVTMAGGVDFVLNRAPRRFRLTGHDILSVMVGNDATGSTNVYLNKGSEEEVALPVGIGMEKIGTVSEDAIGKALKGERGIIFSDPEKLATQLNVYNQNEKARLNDMIAKLQKMVAQIDSAINENIKKAQTYKSEIVSSTPANIPVGEGGTVVVVND